MHLETNDGATQDAINKRTWPDAAKAHDTRVAPRWRSLQNN